MDKTAHRTIDGKIMYLTHKVMLEGSNAARELSMFFMKPQKHHWKAVKHFVGYLEKEKENIRLTYKKLLGLKFMTVANSRFGTNKHNKRSFSEDIFTARKTIIGWSSKA